jgi:hypothetical protein
MYPDVTYTALHNIEQLLKKINFLNFEYKVLFLQKWKIKRKDIYYFTTFWSQKKL